MADHFLPEEWQRINGRLDEDPDRYGFPQRRDGSALLGSFNIRKLGDPDNRSDGDWEFLARVCAQFDLLGVQEIMSDLAGLRRLREELAKHVESGSEGFAGSPPAGPAADLWDFRRVVVRGGRLGLRQLRAGVGQPRGPVELEQAARRGRCRLPDDPRMRLSVEPMTRSKHYRFRQKYLTDHLLETMHRIIDAAAVTAAQQMGMLVPGLGSLTDPDTRSYVTADGCWVPALTSLTSDDIAVDPDTGEVFCRRFDPDALAYHTNDGERASSPGHLLVMVQTRNPYVKERVILAARHKSARNPQMPRNDATIAVDAVLELAARFPQLRAGLRGLVYDMALSAADFDRLLDAGLIPVSKVPLTSTGRYAVANLGEHTFHTSSGASVTRIVHAVNGTPCIVATDGDGIDYYLPLDLVQVKHDTRKHRPLIATRWAVTAHPLAPAGLSGATTRIRHTRTAAERTAGKSRSRAMRVFPESDPRFAEVFGLRQDSESTNSDTKNRLWNRRCRTMGHNSVELNAISYQVHTLVTALLAYHNRTGADLTAWFGQHDLPRKRRHLAVAA